jgi:hypothetical protein
MGQEIGRCPLFITGLGPGEAGLRPGIHGRYDNPRSSPTADGVSHQVLSSNPQSASRSDAVGKPGVPLAPPGTSSVPLGSGPRSDTIVENTGDNWVRLARFDPSPPWSFPLWRGFGSRRISGRRSQLAGPKPRGKRIDLLDWTRLSGPASGPRGSDFPSDVENKGKIGFVCAVFSAAAAVRRALSASLSPG